MHADHADKLEAAQKTLNRIIEMNYKHPPASAGWHTVKVAREFLDSIAPETSCKMCGGTRWVVHPVWGKPCPDCGTKSD